MSVSSHYPNSLPQAVTVHALVREEEGEMSHLLRTRWRQWVELELVQACEQRKGGK